MHHQVAADAVERLDEPGVRKGSLKLLHERAVEPGGGVEHAVLRRLVAERIGDIDYQLAAEALGTGGPQRGLGGRTRHGQHQSLGPAGHVAERGGAWVFRRIASADPNLVSNFAQSLGQRLADFARSQYAVLTHNLTLLQGVIHTMVNR